MNDAYRAQLIDRQGATLEEAARLKLVRDIQRYVCETVYYASGFVGPDCRADQPWLRGSRSSATDGAGTEADTKIWVDRG